ncbi:MAG: flagellar basal-body MS-ring/collar protein FliF [Erythrobacter sp.]|uniref:flagellar basal-body MS-ring/collar protein FliF n=1 Tax=Erythrobacter sp. TaxID=1042 RepID=UPI0032ED967C
MADADPSPAPGAGLPAMSDARLTPLGEGGPVQGSGLQDRLRAFFDQPAMRRAMPAIVGLGSLLLLGALYLALAEPPRRLLFSDLGDLERGQVVEALAAGGIDYRVDPQTGAISVADSDYYAASSLVASNGALPAPQGANEMLDAIPLGSSRTLEGERLRLARERELMLTIKEIHGISGVRVHLATPERSVFVRENDAPSASVMLTLATGRSLSRAQVDAIVNLVAGSVPGMSPDAVRVVDQNGRLLSAPESEDHDALALQREFEAKLREQVSSLLAPLLGAGNFSSQVQVELDHSEVTSARESYDDEGVVRSESERSATRSRGAKVGGVPGVDANTPPPDAELVDGPPQPAEAAADAGAAPVPTDTVPTDTESAVQRNYELGREVAVTSVRPGALRKLSVAVAVSNEALVAAAPMTAEQLESLVAAAVGADQARGDRVAVVVGGFESIETPEPQLWEQPWFMPALRYGTALVAVLLAALFIVRPLMKRARTAGEDKGTGQDADEAVAISAPSPAGDAGAEEDHADLPDQVRLARQLASSRPERAVAALQRMLEAPPEGAEGGASGEARAT